MSRGAEAKRRETRRSRKELSQRFHREMKFAEHQERFSIVELIFAISRETSEFIDASTRSRRWRIIAQIIFLLSLQSSEFYLRELQESSSPFELALEPADAAVPRPEIFQLGCGLLRC